MRHADLMTRMHRAGLRLDDAATAARIAVQSAIRERDVLIAKMIAPRPDGAGLSLRAVGVVFGLSHEAVRKASTRGVVGLTASARTVQPSKSSGG
jgi:hypothetical protein